MDSDHYRRQLLRKQEQQAEAEKKAGDARKKEASKRADAAKARASAGSTRNESTRRSKLRDAERCEGAANSAAKDAATAQGKAAGFASEAATLLGRLGKAEQEEARKRSRASAASQKVADDRHRMLTRRVSRAEADVTALRQLRPPKPERLRILMLAASPEGDLRVGREQSRIRAAVESAHHRDLVEFEAKTSATTKDLLDGLSKFRPHVVHFSGHSDDRLIVLEDDLDDPHQGVVVDAKAFAAALGVLGDPPLLVMLNSCRAASQINDLVAQVVPFAIGMSEGIDDRDAIAYAARFYASVANGNSIAEAHEFGRVQLQLDGLPGADMPRLAHAIDVAPEDVTLVVPPHVAAEHVNA